MVGQVYVQSKAARHGPGVTSIQRHQVELDRFQILEQQLEGGEALETGKRF
jgi:hypothetical protein